MTYQLMSGAGLELGGDLLTCSERNAEGRCIKYLPTCEWPGECLTESPAHPKVPGRKQKKKKRKPTGARVTAKAKKPGPKPEPKRKPEPNLTRAFQEGKEKEKRKAKTTATKIVASGMAHALIEAGVDTNKQKVEDDFGLAFDKFSMDTIPGVSLHDVIGRVEDEMRDQAFITEHNVRADKLKKLAEQGHGLQERVFRTDYIEDSTRSLARMKLKKERPEIKAGTKRYEELEEEFYNELRPDQVWSVRQSAYDKVRHWEQNNLPELRKDVNITWEAGLKLIDRAQSLDAVKPGSKVAERCQQIGRKVHDFASVAMDKAKAEKRQTTQAIDAFQGIVIGGLAGLGGAFLTCKKWKLIGLPGSEVIRCAEYAQTCRPGDADCEERKPKAAKKRKPEPEPPAAEKRIEKPGKSLELALTKDEIQKALSWGRRDQAVSVKYDDERKQWYSEDNSGRTITLSTRNDYVLFTDKVIAEKDIRRPRRHLVTKGRTTEKAQQFHLQTAITNRDGKPVEIRRESIWLPLSAAKAIGPGIWTFDKWLKDAKFSFVTPYIKVGEVERYTELPPIDLSKFSHGIETGDKHISHLLIFEDREAAESGLKEGQSRGSVGKTRKVARIDMQGQVGAG